MRVLGLEIPDAGPVFAGVLATHIAAGLTCVGAATTACVARKRPGTHPRWGRVYLWALGVVAVSAMAMAGSGGGHGGGAGRAGRCGTRSGWAARSRRC
jgi:hypothetical protein